jgi:hypothetical protein
MVLMMSHYLIYEGTIVNWILVDESLLPEQQYQPPESHVLVRHDPKKYGDAPGGIGWKWDGRPVDPNPPVALPKSFEGEVL